MSRRVRSTLEKRDVVRRKRPLTEEQEDAEVRRIRRPRRSRPVLDESGRREEGR